MSGFRRRSRSDAADLALVTKSATSDLRSSQPSLEEQTKRQEQLAERLEDVKRKKCDLLFELQALRHVGFDTVEIERELREFSYEYVGQTQGTSADFLPRGLNKYEKKESENRVRSKSTASKPKGIQELPRIKPTKSFDQEACDMITKSFNAVL